MTNENSLGETEHILVKAASRSKPSTALEKHSKLSDDNESKSSEVTVVELRPL